MLATIVPWFVVVGLFLATTTQGLSQKCPAFTVIGPSRILQKSEPGTFVLQSQSGFASDYRFIWSIENGRILSGQGTRVVEAISDDHGVTLKATVKIHGLTAGCPDTATEMAGIAPKLEWESLDSWGELPNDDQRARLDVFFAELANYPDQKGLVILQILRRSNGQVDRRRLKLTLDHVRFRRFDVARLAFCIAYTKDLTRTTLYRYPVQLEAEAPTNGCKLMQGRDLK